MNLRPRRLGDRVNAIISGLAQSDVGNCGGGSVCRLGIPSVRAPHFAQFADDISPSQFELHPFSSRGAEREPDSDCSEREREPAPHNAATVRVFKEGTRLPARETMVVCMAVATNT
jgi:hypothetical protein